MRFFQKLGISFLLVSLLLPGISYRFAQAKQAKKQIPLTTSQQVKSLQGKLLQLKAKYKETYDKYRMFHTLWVIEKLKCDPKYTKNLERMKAAPDLFRKYHTRK